MWHTAALWSQRLFTASASTTDVTAQLHICGLVRLLPTAVLVEDGSVSATLEPSLVGYTTVTRTNTYPWSSQLPRRYAALLEECATVEVGVLRVVHVQRNVHLRH